ncbi:MAG TPA: hypothetical protein VF950_26050 [Planctomycetota bacterium]
MRRRGDGRGGRGTTSLLDDLLRDAGTSLLNGFGERVSSSMRDLLRGTARRCALAATGVAVLGAGAVFLLIAGAEAFKALSLPPSAAYLCMGLLGLIVGYLLTRVRG